MDAHTLIVIIKVSQLESHGVLGGKILAERSVLMVFSAIF